MYNKINVFAVLNIAFLVVSMYAAQTTVTQLTPQFDISVIKTAHGDATYARVTNVLT